MKITAYLIVCLLLTTVANATSLKGIVKDAKTGEGIISATILLKDLPDKKVVSGLDGSFVVNLSQKSCVLVCSSIGYAMKEVSVNNTEEYLTILLEPVSSELSTVIVEGYNNKGSERSGILFRKNSMNILEVVSAKTIEISPDLNVANVLQRVSSVSLERTSGGQAQYAIIRGMDKRYSYTLVNGVKIPSPDNRFRYVPMDLFPSDLLDRLVVTKALTPDMEGDAIGGAMNMVMKDAPGKPTLNINAAVGYNSLFFDRDFTTFGASAVNYKSPKELNSELYQVSKQDFSTGNATFTNKKADPNLVFGFSAGNRFLNKKLGVMLAGSFQNNNYGNNSTFINTSVKKDDNQPFVNTVTEREYSTAERRIGINAKADYLFNANHRIDAQLLVVNLNKREFRNAIDQNKELANRIEVWKRSRTNQQDVINGILSGKHKFAKERFNVQWLVAWSKASQDNPDQVNLKLAQDEIGFVDNPTLRWNFGSSRRWESNDDKDISGMLNVEYSHSIGRSSLTYTAGTMYRTKKRTNNYNEYNFDSGVPVQLYTGWADAVLEVRNPLGVQQSPLNYVADENVAAGFGMVKWTEGKWTVTGGVRFEKTHMTWETEAPKHIYGKTGSRDYPDVLPSANIRYAITPKQNIRLSYYSSISRPGFFEVIPYVLPGDEYNEAGNPYLKRVQANNADLRYELFPGNLDFITAGIFYKNIKNPIELSLSGSELKPENFGNARNMGFEAEVTKYFRKFGIKMNYSYTNSQITTTKDLWGRSDVNDPTSELVSTKVNQTRPLQGQSQHIANFSILYKDGKNGLDIQLANIFTGRRIAMVSPYYDRDLWQRDMIQMDLSAEKRICGKFSAYLKAGNLLNTPYILEVKGNTVQSDIPIQDKDNKLTVRKDVFERTILIGLRYKL